MTKVLVYSTDAAADVHAALHWLETVRPGLGRRFLGELDRVTRQIDAHPESYELIYRGCRRAVLRRFDYVLVYRNLPERIEVIGLLHCRLDPATSVQRLAVGP